MHEAPLQHIGHVAVPGVVHADDSFGARDVEEAGELAKGDEAVGDLGSEDPDIIVSGGDRNVRT